MKHLKYFNSLPIKESTDQITVPDVAWLNLLCYVYKGKLSIESWHFDTRMGDMTCDQSLSKFSGIKKEDGYYVANSTHFDIVDEYFYNDDLMGTLSLESDLKKYNIPSYKISNIPFELFLKKKPEISKSFDSINDLIVDHYNSQTCSTSIINRIKSAKNIDKFNLMKLYRNYSTIPTTLIVYRGIKREYDESYNKSGYSCWTTSIDQAKRFSRYYFTGGYQFSPSESDVSYILTAEIRFEDIIIFIGGEESEVILKNPVKIQSIKKTDK